MPPITNFFSKIHLIYWMTQGYSHFDEICGNKWINKKMLNDTFYLPKMYLAKRSRNIFQYISISLTSNLDTYNTIGDLRVWLWSRDLAQLSYRQCFDKGFDKYFSSGLDRPTSEGCFHLDWPPGTHGTRIQYSGLDVWFHRSCKESIQIYNGGSWH